MRRHKHLFEQVVSFQNLLAAARAALQGRRSRQPGAAFYADLESQVVDLQAELSTGVYRPGDYHYFQIHEPKERTVAAAPFRDRVVHHAIVRVIQPIFEKRFIEDSFASRPGKGTHAAMRRASQFAQRYPYALKCGVVYGNKWNSVSRFGRQGKQFRRDSQAQCFPAALRATRTFGPVRSETEFTAQTSLMPHSDLDFPAMDDSTETGRTCKWRARLGRALT